MIIRDVCVCVCVNNNTNEWSEAYSGCKGTKQKMGMTLILGLLLYCWESFGPCMGGGYTAAI